MNIFYDTEFIDNGYDIDPISFGMHREDGAEYYAINDSIIVINDAVQNKWLRDNVVSQLPVEITGGSIRAFQVFSDRHHYDYRMLKPLTKIREEIEAFVLGTPDVQLWADYAAHDHIVLTQLFGPMMELPPGFPMYTNEFRTLLMANGNPEIPPYRVPIGAVYREHHALYDARELAYRYDHLTSA